MTLTTSEVGSAFQWSVYEAALGLSDPNLAVFNTKTASFTTVITVYFFIGWVVGILLGYVVWAPETRFKRNFVDGLTLRFLWGRFVK